jgi:tryptophanyl-tRNA synthetase
MSNIYVYNSLVNRSIAQIKQISYNTSMKKRVLSGIRATGRLHLGNYLGAVKGMLALQDSHEYETLYMVADLHAITTPFDVEELRKNRREVILDYLAAGLDPKKSILFQQADNPHHAELAFYLSSVMSIARMQHLPTFKDKVKQYPHNATMALLNYPILMAADILIYKASAVPVGIDQEPHLEVAREIARKMNDEYGLDFPEPKSFKSEGEYIPSLVGEGKMSKSVEGSYINLTDDLATVKAKVAKIPTDSGKGSIKEGEKGSIYVSENGQEAFGVSTLMTFIELFSGKEFRTAFEQQYTTSGIRYGEVKPQLAEAIHKELQPLQEKRRYFEEHSEEVTKIIADGNAKATALAKQTLIEVREKMGLK